MKFQKATKPIYDSDYTLEFNKYMAAMTLGLIFGGKPKSISFDCNDYDGFVNPGIQEGKSAEHCNLIDDDCDGEIDECSETASTGTMDVKIAIPFFGGSAKTLKSSAPACVYSGTFKGCQVYDSDGDGYNNASFGCLSCTDCDDSKSDINPSTKDDGSGYNGDTIGLDDNCNGQIDEQADKDKDGVPDGFETKECIGQGKDYGAIVDENGCWISPTNKNLVGWSIGK